MGPVGGPRDVRVDARRRVLRSVCWTSGLDLECEVRSDGMQRPSNHNSSCWLDCPAHAEGGSENIVEILLLMGLMGGLA